MSIEAFCQTNVVTIFRGATLKEVANLMTSEHVGSVVVVAPNEDGIREPVGIITDRDIALTVAQNDRPGELKVENIMQSKPLCARVDEGLFEIVQKMRDYGVKRLPIVNPHGALYGIICADDLLALMGQEIKSISQVTDRQITKEGGYSLPVGAPPQH